MYPEIKTIKNNPSLKGSSNLIRDIEYSPAQGQKLDLLVPWAVGAEGHDEKFPLIVFLQGSAWMFPDTDYQLPQLSRLANEGWVVASIEHRNSLDGHPWPAFLEDTKAAIRFLRANADKYGIDPERVAMFGTSSGGNTALLVGVTGDEAEFKTAEYADQSDSVKAVVDCFGPSDLKNMFPDDVTGSFDAGAKALFMAVAGNNDPIAVEKVMSPINHVVNGKKYPPFLLLHGDADPVVPFSQSESMFKRLIDAGAEAELVRVEGAEHEGTFWSKELWDIIIDFLKKNL